MGRKGLLVAHSLEGNPRVQVVREPGGLDDPLLGEALDSDRVDVAPGSNVVGVNQQGYRHFSSLK